MNNTGKAGEKKSIKGTDHSQGVQLVKKRNARKSGGVPWSPFSKKTIVQLNKDKVNEKKNFFKQLKTNIENLKDSIETGDIEQKKKDDIEKSMDSFLFKDYGESVKLFKSIVYTFIWELVKNEENILKENILKEYYKLPKTITDTLQGQSRILFKDFIKSYYSNGIKIIYDGESVKSYYKYNETTKTYVKNENNSIQQQKILIIRIKDKTQILIHQVLQQILLALLDVIIDNDYIIKEYLKIEKNMIL